MRVGRLQSSTLSSIWKSLEPNLEGTFPQDNCAPPALPEKLQKQYIPMSSDSPLYRLISVTAGSSSLSINNEATQQQEGIIANHLAFFHRNPSRVMSVPALPVGGLDNHLPQPRVAQSTGDLFPVLESSSTNPQPAGAIDTRPTIPRQFTSRQMFSSGAYAAASNPQILPPLPPTPPAAHSHSNSEDGDRPVTFGRNTTAPQLLPTSSILSRATSLSASAATKIERKHWSEDYMHMDIDWSMQAMDVLYSASFYDYIRDERNCDLSAQRLCRIIKDYKPRQVANALLWMIQGWSVENTSKLLRTIFSDWLPDLAGCVFSLISRNWPKQPQASLCVAFLLMNEPAASAALFIRSLTQGWTRKESIDLLTYLDAVLKWNSSYLQEVMTIYTTSVYGESQSRMACPAMPIGKNDETVELSRVPHSALDENSELSKASKKLMVANARLAMAEYQLALFSHWSICPKCQVSDECDIAKNLPIPEYQVVGGSELSLDASASGSSSKDSLFDDDSEHSGSEE